MKSFWSIVILSLAVGVVVAGAIFALARYTHRNDSELAPVAVNPGSRAGGPYIVTMEHDGHRWIVCYRNWVYDGGCSIVHHPDCCKGKK